MQDLEWCRTPTTVAVDPAWTFASGAVDGLAALDPAHRALVDQAIDGPDSFERKREVIDQFGWRHFGEIYGDHEALGHTGSTPLVSHYNNQYDPILGFGLQFLRTADPRWRQAMNELAAHVITNAPHFRLLKGHHTNPKADAVMNDTNLAGRQPFLTKTHPDRRNTFYKHSNGRTNSPHANVRPCPPELCRSGQRPR